MGYLDVVKQRRRGTLREKVSTSIPRRVTQHYTVNFTYEYTVNYFLVVKKLLCRTAGNIKVTGTLLLFQRVIDYVA